MQFQPVDSANEAYAAQILAEAFHDDPVINWSLNRPASLLPFFEFTLPVLVPHGLTYIDPDGNGAACWLGPKQKLKWPMGPSQAWKILSFGGMRGLYRMLLSGLKTERYHPKTPHYYLFAIGVVPHGKGQGLGTKLITELLRRCDEEGVPAYLENSKEENLPFYEGHGFKVQRQIRFAASAPPLWLMWREPQQS
ncbi:MAG: ribosomal protein S18 acetylase RimI-like enzyme [Bacteroidia bacterium]|jgi:ribosomal protein S18 acetylase RimI-like enzyme